MMVDLFAAYTLVKKLVLPFDQWPAYRSGVINAQGDIIVPKYARNHLQNQTFNPFDVLALNLKKRIGPLGGVGLAAAVAYFMKEPKPVRENIEDESMPELDEALAQYIEEDGPVMSAGAGGIAGIGIGPQGEPPKSTKKKSNMILRRKYRVNDLPTNAAT